MDPSIVPVILSGGAGKRLWPLSRADMPKQFLELFDNGSLFQNTVTRLRGMPGCAAPMVVCHEAHRFLAAEHLRQINCPSQAILLEPQARNTALAVAVAAHWLVSVAKQPQALMLVLPTDHLLDASDALFGAFAEAAKAAPDKLVTFGVRPTRPATGYGYIQAQPDGRAAVPIKQFIEKPDQATAETFLKSGDYFWNSGMFMFSARRLLAELQAAQPQVAAAAAEAVGKRQADLDFQRLDGEAYAQCPSVSIDYGLLEKSPNVALVPLEADWRDVGSWTALHELKEPDQAGNVLHGDALAFDAENCYLHAGTRLLVAHAVQELVVVETSNAILISHRDHAQGLSEVVDKLAGMGRAEVVQHREVFRPWGSYDSLDMGRRFQVKRLTVKPGQAISMQRHAHRSEHWVVVSGQAEVTCDDKTFTLGENQSAYIPLGSTHRLANPGEAPLEVIEVQSGHYLGEDDIERFDDRYGRH